MKQIYTILFDLDGTIVNTAPDLMAAHNHVMKKFGHNKSRDPEGLNRSIFHDNCVGRNLKLSLLMLFNKIKREGKVPQFMKSAVITTIPKKGSKFVLKNERGIFVLSAVRTILMRLLYNTQYETINQSISDSNVGARKKMSSINHIFILNGVCAKHFKELVL